MLKINPLTFESNSRLKDNKQRSKNIIMYSSACALLLPLAPIIDGDGFKSTYKNKNIAKMVTGMAAVGGLFGLAKFSTDNWVNNSANPPKSKTIRNTVVGAVACPAMLLVNDWASAGKKIAAKWYLLTATAGAGIAYIASAVNRNT